MTEKEIQEKLENNICFKCGEKILTDHMLLCEKCYNEIMEKVIQGDTSLEN